MSASIKINSVSAETLREILWMAEKRLDEYRSEYVPQDEATVALCRQIRYLREGVQG